VTHPSSGHRRDREPGPPLTRRERAVLAEAAHGGTVDEIAARLWVTRNTVKSQLSSAYRKLGVSTRAQAVDRVDSWA
jgi:LuxR family transcriptional regulator, transcriptional regulator of spore coat protein